jgi:hypothetical protein
MSNHERLRDLVLRSRIKRPTGGPVSPKRVTSGNESRELDPSSTQRKIDSRREASKTKKHDDSFSDRSNVYEPESYPKEATKRAESRTFISEGDYPPSKGRRAEFNLDIPDNFDNSDNKRPDSLDSPRSINNLSLLDPLLRPSSSSTTRSVSSSDQGGYQPPIMNMLPIRNREDVVTPIRYQAGLDPSLMPLLDTDSDSSGRATSISRSTEYKKGGRIKRKR